MSIDIFNKVYITPQGTVKWITPVFDRVYEDCVYGNSKGTITAEVLNRIENNIIYLEYLLNEYNRFYSRQFPSGLSVKLNWVRTDYYRLKESLRIKQNTMFLRTSNLISKDTPILKILATETNQFWNIYNDIEQIAFDIIETFYREVDDWIYCGDGFESGNSSLDDKRLEVDKSDIGDRGFITQIEEWFIVKPSDLFIDKE